MRGRVLFITALFILGSYAGNLQRENFIIEGTGNFDESDVQIYEFNFGSNWRGPVGSTVYINFEFDEVAIRPFGEPESSFRYFPPGETTSIPLTFALVPLNFLDDPLVFPVVQDDPRICANITKRAPINQICIRGDSSCNGIYEYQLNVGTRFDFARTNIEYIGGSPPNLVESSEVLTPAANTFYGKLGATFQVGVEGTATVLINATDFQGEPRGSILWYFRAGGSGAETLLPGSLAGVTITDAGDGQSILRVSGVNAAHVGEYIAVATNEHGEDRASAFITQGVPPFITVGTGQSSSSSFRVGADRDAILGETINIRAEDRQSNPSSTISWSYSRSESGPYSAIISGGPYSISFSSGGNNIGTDSILRISNVGSGQYGYYRAEAVNPQGTYTSSSSLIGRSPQLNLGSGIETDGSGNIGSDYNTNLGSTITIRAQDTTGFPTSSIRWQRYTQGGALQDVTSGGRYQITTSGATSVLRINGVTASELGLYRATASNVFGDSQGESLVGTPSSANTGTSIIRVSNGFSYESGARFDTSNANRFTIRATDPTGVPIGTSSFQYSRTVSGSRTSVDRRYAIIRTPTGVAGAIDFFNLVDGAYGYYFVTNTNRFGSGEGSNLVGARLVFETGNNQIGQNYQLALGGSQTITASFSDGFPYGQIVWRGPNGQIITSTTPGYTIALGESVSQLVINSARSGIDYGTYTATASNLFGTVTATSVVSETVVVVAPVIEEGNTSTINEASGGVVQGIIGESFRAAPGEIVTITVNDIAGQEASSIRFSRLAPGSSQFIDITNNPAYTIVTATNAGGFTDATISFAAGPNTYGTFRAEASNSAGSDAVISQVGQAPRIEVSGSLIRIVSGQTRNVDVGGQVNIQEGGSVVLQAEDIEGQPGRNFIWTYRNNPTGPFGPLPSSTRINPDVSGNTGLLTINNIDRTIYGEYRVVATNDFGTSAPVTTVVGGPPIIRFSSGTVTSGQGEIGNDFILPFDNRLRIIACVVGGYPPADPEDFLFEEEGVELESVQQPDAPNCFIYEEGEFEITCGTTISTRTSNIFGRSNVPSSRIIFPPPTIVPGTATCDQGNSQTSVQIGSELCLYGRDTFEISCSVERTNIPNFSFEWLFNGAPIRSGGKYNIRNPNIGNSVLTVSGITVDDTGRYGCRVRSTCGETDLESTDVSTYNYEYICNEAVGRTQCLESINGGPQTVVPKSICDGLGLQEPPCDICDWIMSPWGQCSDPTCHRGRRNRQVICECNGLERPDSDCTLRPKPETIDRCGPLGVRCNRPCQWKEYDFGSCSRTCGGDSYRERNVECVDLVTDNRVNEDCCNVLFKPEVRLSCDVPDCNNCIDLLSQQDCGIFVDLAGNCNPYPYSVRRACCATCRRRGL